MSHLTVRRPPSIWPRPRGSLNARAGDPLLAPVGLVVHEMSLPPNGSRKPAPTKQITNNRLLNQAVNRIIYTEGGGMSTGNQVRGFSLPTGDEPRTYKTGATPACRHTGG